MSRRGGCCDGPIWIAILRLIRDLAFVAFLIALVGMGLRRPFLLVLGYVYVDIVAPQRLTYLLLNTVPISLIMVLLAVGGWAIADDKRAHASPPGKCSWSCC